MEDLAIQLTASGTSALAVVRLRGPGARAFVASHFNRPVARGRVVYGRWRDEAGEVIDDGLVVAGDGWCDLNLHGGRRIVAKLLEQAAMAGFRVILGEAAIDAAARDDVEAWLPRATTEAGLRALLAQPAAWRAVDPAHVDVAAVLADQTLFRLLNPATVAIVGAANVGKSTLANRLVGRERSIVADVPGTTRDWVGGHAELDGLPVILIDTPGRRETGDAIERAAIELSEAPVAAADVVVLVVDAMRPAEVPGGFEAALRVANKCDLAAAPAGCLPISAATGAGMTDLVASVHARLGVAVRGAHRPMWWTPGQRELLSRLGRRAVTPIAQRLAGY